MANTLIDGRVSVRAIRKANEKRIGRRTHSLSENSRSTGEIHVRYSSGLTTRQVIITRDQISSAYRKALNKNGKKI